MPILGTFGSASLKTFGLSLAGPPNLAFSLEMRFSNTADAPSIVIPANSVPGDLCLFVDTPARVLSAQEIPPVTPTGVSGFAPISLYNTLARNDLAIFTWAKILATGDPGATITGTNTATATGYRRKSVLIFRKKSDVGPINTFTARDIKNQGTGGDPTAQTISSAIGTVPLIALAVYRGTGSLTNQSMSPQADGTVSNGSTTEVKWRIFNFNDTATDVTVDVGDTGDSTMLQSFFLEIT